MLILLVALMLGVMAAPAAAQTEPMPSGTAIVPRDGQVWSASSWPAATPFQMHAFVAYASTYDELPDAFVFTVANTPATGADGLLANAIDRYDAPAQPDHPGIYAATTSLGARWRGTPGTYYWQATYVEDDEDEAYASSVRAFTVIAQPPPDVAAPPAVILPPPPTAILPAPSPRPPDASTARAIVPRATAPATHRVARGLVYRCAGAICRPSWRDARFRYRGTLTIAIGANGITASFTGKRTSSGRTARAVAWSTPVT